MQVKGRKDDNFEEQKIAEDGQKRQQAFMGVVGAFQQGAGAAAGAVGANKGATPPPPSGDKIAGNDQKSAAPINGNKPGGAAAHATTRPEDQQS